MVKEKAIVIFIIPFLISLMIGVDQFSIFKNILDTLHTLFSGNPQAQQPLEKGKEAIEILEMGDFLLGILLIFIAFRTGSPYALYL